MSELLLQAGNPEGIVPYFSPASFLVFIDDVTIGQTGITAIQSIVDRGDTQRGLQLLRDHIEKLSPNSESSFLRAFTAPFHEFKHYWDFIGTTYGLARMGLTARRHINISLLLDLLPKDSPLVLPLLENLPDEWIDGDAAHEIISEIREIRFNEQVLDDVGLLFFPADRPLDEYPPKAHMIVQGPNEVHWVPAYAARCTDPETGNGWILAVPFGGRAICEAAAMALELDMLAGVFGRQFADERKRDFMGFSLMQQEKSYYGACDLYLSRHVEKFPFDLVIALCDIALLGEMDGRERDSFHPGWRFCKLVEVVAQDGWPEHQEDWEVWYKQLFKSMNGRSLEEFLSATRTRIAKAIATIQSRDGMDDGKASFFATLFRQADAVFAVRQKAPLILASSELLYSSIMNRFGITQKAQFDNPSSEVSLPLPTVVRASNAAAVGEIATLPSQIGLFVESKVLSDILLRSEILCPLVESGVNCPLKTEGCGLVPEGIDLTHHPRCVFLSAVRNQGLLDKSVVSTIAS